MRRTGILIGLAAVGLASCETYELPPRLLGVGTEACPECEELVLSESRLAVGEAAVTAEFAFEDDQGSLTAVRIFVTTPSGVVLEEPYEVPVEVPADTDTDGEPTVVLETRYRDGFTCVFSGDLEEQVPSLACVVSGTRFNNILATSVAARLEGYQQGELAATFGVPLSEVGEWTVEVEAERSGGTLSNRLSATFDVAEDIGDSGGDTE